MRQSNEEGLRNFCVLQFLKSIILNCCSILILYTPSAFFLQLCKHRKILKGKIHNNNALELRPAFKKNTV